jgi:hypothetical protein
MQTVVQAEVFLPRVFHLVVLSKPCLSCKLESNHRRYTLQPDREKLARIWVLVSQVKKCIPSAMVVPMDAS